MLALALVALSLGIVALGLGGYLQPIQSLTLRPLGAIQGWVAIRFTAMRDLLTAPDDLAALRLRNSELEAEVGRLRQEVIALQGQVAGSEVLAALVNYARSQPESRYQAADVIGRDVSPFIRSIWIGVGSDAGISRGMPVVTERGLVGRVVEVYATISRVQLITDPAGAVNVFLQKAQAEGVLEAQLNGELWVDLISQDAVVSPGELVLTSGLGGNYPADIPVGRVTSVRKRDYEIFQQAVIETDLELDRLSIVLVITNFNPPSVRPAGP